MEKIKKKMKKLFQNTTDCLTKRDDVSKYDPGGSGEIRTHGGRKPSVVFKTTALNRSATLPRRTHSDRFKKVSLRVGHKADTKPAKEPTFMPTIS